jgi:hypothetical protein
MPALELVLALALVALPDNEPSASGLKGASGFGAELLVDARNICVGDVLVTKLRVVNLDRVALPLSSPDVAGSGRIRYEFRREGGTWQDYQFLGMTECVIPAGHPLLLAPGACQSELMSWARGKGQRSSFTHPGTYRLRARCKTGVGEVTTDEVRIKVSKPITGATVERADMLVEFPWPILLIPWTFKVAAPDQYNFQLIDTMEPCNAKQILLDVKRLNDFMNTGAVDGRRTSLVDFLAWIDKQNSVRRECLLIPMGHAYANKADVEALREILHRLPDRSGPQSELASRLERLEKNLQRLEQSIPSGPSAK